MHFMRGHIGKMWCSWKALYDFCKKNRIRII